MAGGRGEDGGEIIPYKERNGLKCFELAGKMHYIGPQVITMAIQDLVLATVNAPYSHKLTALMLAFYLLHPGMAINEVPGHVSSFFAEVKPDLQEAFAHTQGISHDQLTAAAKEFASYSGEDYPLAA